MYGATSYASAPYAAPSGASGAKSSPITALLAGNLHVLFEHLMWFQPYDSVSYRTVDLFVSGGWYKSGAGATFPTGESAPHQLFLGHLVQPPNRETRIWQSGDVNTSAPSYGTCVVADANRELVDWQALNWANKPARHFMGDPIWPLNGFAEVFRGLSTEISPQIDRLEIHLQDVVAKLQSATYQQQRYAGRGPCIRLDGSASYLSGTVTRPLSSLTLGIRVRARASITTDEAIMGWRNGSSAGACLLRTGASNAVAFAVRNDAGTLFEASAPAVLVTYRWKDLWGVLDMEAMTIAVYEGATPDAPLATTAITGAFTTALTAFAIGRLPDTASGYLLADVDDATLWGHALSSVEIVKWTGSQPPSGTAGLLYQWTMAENTGGAAYESAGSGPDLALHSAIWVDSLTGGADIAGKCVPQGVGIRRQVQPVMLSSVDLIYQVARSFDHLAAEDGPNLFDGGERVWTFAGVYSDPWAVDPGAGQYIEIPEMGLIRLGGDSAPVKGLTCDVYLTAAVDLPSCVSVVVLDDGALAPSEFDAGSALALPQTRGVGVWYGLDPVSVDTALLELLSAVKGWRAANDFGALAFGRILPPETLVPDAEAGPDDFGWDGIQSVYTQPAAKAVQIAYKPYSQTTDAGSASVLLTPARKQDLSLPVRTIPTPDDPKVMKADATAVVAPPIATPLDSALDAADRAATEALWRSKPRRTDLLPLSEPVPRFRVGQVLLITMGIYDYAQGKKVLVTATIADDGQGQHSIEVTGAVQGADVLLLGGSSDDVALLGDGSGAVLL